MKNEKTMGTTLNKSINVEEKANKVSQNALLNHLNPLFPATSKWLIMGDVEMGKRPISIY